VVLTGIHICSYGADRGQGSEALPELAIRIGRIAGIDRIRFGSLEPQSITPRFAELAAAVRGLCPHFHLSLQSGSDSILSRMNRRYDTDRFRESVKLLRARFPQAALTTDVMVGYPGETEDMHRQSLEFVREIGFSRLHVFRYSRRSGTTAASLPDQVPKEIAIRRSTEMQALGDELARQYHARLVGHPQTVLIEQVLADGSATGYTDTYVPVILEKAEGCSSNSLVTVVPVRADHEFLVARHAQGPVSC
jgi:threonylcarbamoyladenosine tRNA methylthiotransferase MtaB